MPNEQLKKEMVERGKGKIAKLTGRIAIYNHSKKNGTLYRTNQIKEIRRWEK